MNPIFFISKCICWLGYKLFFRFTVKGTKNLPKKGGILILSNHVSMFDPPAVGSAAFKRPTWYMARDTLFKNPVFGAFLKSINAIPINRGTGFRGGYQKVKDRLAGGGAVIAFPEGTRSLDGNLQPGKAGVGMIIYETKAKVIPCYISGADKALPKGRTFPVFFTRISVTFGPEVPLEDLLNLPEEKTTYQQMIDRVMEHIGKLRD